MPVLRVVWVLLVLVVVLGAISSGAVSPPTPARAEPVPAVAPPPAPAAVPPLAPAAPAPATPPAAPALVAGTPCAPTARACIDLSANQTWLIRDGAVAYGPVPITHGRPGYRTPPGLFRVTFKQQLHLSSLFNDAPMPYSVFFNGGIAFHQGSLRVPSHGCIHLSAAAARAYFAALNRGDVVQVVP